MQYPTVHTEPAMDGLLVQTYVEIEEGIGFDLVPDMTLLEAQRVAEALLRHLSGGESTDPAAPPPAPPSLSDGELHVEGVTA